MTFINNNASVLALRIETTEGTPLLASASGDFVSLQPGFEFTPEVDSLQNEEIKATIAPSASRPGIRRVKGSLSHYIRASGVEGGEPDWGILLESLLGGKSVEGTERDLTSGSTTVLLKGNTGVGATQFKGKAILVKDGTNGYSIRNIKAIATDDLTPNFALPGAPASGVKLGKCVSYYGVDTGHSSLTGDLFRGNGGSREVAAGLKCTEMSVDVKAAEYINGKFNLQGTKHYFDAIEIKASNKWLDFHDGSTDYHVSMTEKVYSDPYELAAEILAKMVASGASLTTPSVTWNDYGTKAGKFTIAVASGTLTLKFLTGTNTANTIAPALGFSVADKSGATSYDSTNAVSWANAITTSYDDATPSVAVNTEMLIGDATETHSVKVTNMTIKCSNDSVERKSTAAETGVEGIGFRGRTSTWDVTAYLEQHEVRYFKKLRANDDVMVMFNFGEKSGSNWVAGKCMNLYSPTCKIVDCKVNDQDGDAVLAMTVEAYAASGETRELFINQL